MAASAPGTVVFDLDGTIADTAADLIAAANDCFEGLGHGAQLDPAGDAATAFHGGRAMLRLGFERCKPGFTEADVDGQYQRLLDFYGANICVHTTLYPGAEAAIAWLSDAGYRLAVCTNKPEALAHLLLDRLGLGRAFGAMIGADTLAQRKPDPAPYRAAVAGAGGEVARSFLVGDTETDRKTARAAGVPCALITFGPEGEGIARLEPEALLHHYDDLPALAARLLG